MFFKRPDLTSGSRPILEQDEVLHFVQNGVGLYEGKYKIADCQNGHAYLTSHRACYVDDKNPKQNSLSFDLKDVDRHEYQASFLRSSAKVTIYPKPLKRGFGSLRRPSPSPMNIRQLQLSSSSPTSRTASPFRPSAIQATPTPVVTGTWVCPICSFNNPVPSNFDPTIATEAFPLPPCLTCGIPPPFSLVLKAAINASSNRPPPTNINQPPSVTPGTYQNGDSASVGEVSDTICPRCTFHNHPSLRICEICGAQLRSSYPSISQARFDHSGRSESPGPEIASLQLDDSEEVSFVKFSFREGGDKAFSEKLRNALIQRRWLAANAPPIPRPLDSLRAHENSQSDSGSPPRSPRGKTGVGIAGLEQRGMQSRKMNEAVIATAFEDWETLMASAKEIVALAEKFARESKGLDASDASGLDPSLSESANALSMLTTRSNVGDSSNSLYISELARGLTEFITNERRGILRRNGGIMSLVDIWAEYNSWRNGIELVNPNDCYKAAEMCPKLGLPVRLRQFKSGLMVVHGLDWNDEKTMARLKTWLESLRQSPSLETAAWDHDSFGCGVTAQDAAQRFGWSLGVATEELEMAEEKGILCREEGIQGLKFWLNHLAIDKEE